MSNLIHERGKAFDAARNAALASRANSSPRVYESDYACDERGLYIMFMYKTAKDQRKAVKNGAAGALIEIVQEELRARDCTKHLIPEVDIRIRNFEENRDESWAGSR